mmetsp:Transcript_53801/g.93838  ORF Transcript_53801/g.93838 Transcript_53801/m.93838 type:complete len:321 (-) Transcript_53801:2574-3536(-)
MYTYCLSAHTTTAIHPFTKNMYKFYRMPLLYGHILLFVYLLTRQNTPFCYFQLNSSFHGGVPDGHLDAPHHICNDGPQACVDHFGLRRDDGPRSHSRRSSGTEGHVRSRRSTMHHLCGEGAVGPDIRTNTSSVPFFVGSAGLIVRHIIQCHVVIHAGGRVCIRHEVGVRAAEIDAVARAERDRHAVALALGLLGRIIVNSRDTCPDASCDAVRMWVHGVGVGARGQRLAYGGERNAHTLVAIGASAQVIFGVHDGHGDTHNLLHRCEPTAQPQQTQCGGLHGTLCCEVVNADEVESLQLCIQLRQVWLVGVHDVLRFLFV